MKRIRGLLVAFCFVVPSIPLVSVAQLPTPASPVGGSFTFATIDFPGGTRTRAAGLNGHGDIVGDYFDSNNVRHGYLLSQGQFTSFDPPGSIQTRGLAINNRGYLWPLCG